MSQPTTSVFFNSTTPAAPSGNQNVKPQSDGGTPQANVSFYPQPATDSLLGVVRPDGTTITIDDGVISGVPGALLHGDGPPATSAFVQAASGGGDSLAFANPVTSGDLLVVTFKSEGSLSGITISDTLGTSYSLATSITGQANNIALYYGLAPSSGANTVSIGSAPGNFDRLAVAEFSNVNATVDASATLWNGGGTNPEGLSITTTAAGDLIVFAVGGYHDADTFAFSDGFTLDSQSNGSDANAIGHQIAEAAGTYTASVTISGAGADNSDLILVAFTAAAAPGVDGDFYLDVTSGVLYGPRTGGSYTAVATGVVPQGSAGQVLATPAGASGAASLRVLASSDLPVATTSAPGAVQPDGSTITISDGVITAVGGGGGGDGGTLLSGSGLPAATVTHVQSTGNTFASPVTAGNLLIVCLHTQADIQTNCTVTDSVGTTYTLNEFVNGASYSDDASIAIFSGIAPASGTNTVAITGQNGYTNIIVAEFSGVTSTVDVSGGQYQFGTGNSGIPLTTTVPDLIYVFMAAWDNGVNFTGGSGFTIDQNQNGNPCAGSAYCVDGTPGAITAQIIPSSGNDTPICAVAFKIAAVAPGDTGDWYLDTANGVLYGPRNAEGGTFAVTTGIVPQGAEGLVLATPVSASGPASLRALQQTDIPPPQFGSGSPTVSGTEGGFYFDTSTSPWTGYVYHSTSWNQFS